MNNLHLMASSLLLVTAMTGAAIAADPIMDLPLVRTDAFDWSGFYAGTHIGAASNANNGFSAEGPLFPPFLVLPPTVVIPTLVLGEVGTLSGTGGTSGPVGGAQIGYNWQVKNVVFGLEADATATRLGGSTASAVRTLGGVVPPLTETVSVDFGAIGAMASFRARAGLAVNKALFYLTGGGAVAQVGGSTTTVTFGPGIALPAGTFTATNSAASIRWGWTVGAGVEWAINDKWSIGGEYRHTDFGSGVTTFTIPDGLGTVFATGTANQRLTIGQATLRINYHPG